MARFTFAFALAAAALVGFSLGLGQSARDRPAAAILADLEAARFPGGLLDDEGVRRLEAVCRRRCELGLELFEAWPQHPRAREAIADRWTLLSNTFEEHATVLNEVETVLRSDQASRYGPHARRARAWASAHADCVPVERALSFAEAVHAEGAGDTWLAEVFIVLASRRCVDAAMQRRLCARVSDELDVDSAVRAEARNWRALVDRIGRPLDLGLEELSLAAWRGRPLALYVRGADDLEPFTEETLAELEVRLASRNVVVAELVIGQPQTPPTRAGRRLVAPPTESADSWQFRFGILQTPLFLAVDAQGVLEAVTLSMATLESFLSRPAS